MQRYASVLADAGALEVAVADDAQEAEALMAGRRALHAALELKGPHFTEDVCVPVRRLADLIRTGHRLGAEHGVDVTLSGHGGDGNLHPCFFFTLDDPDSRRRAEAAFDGLVREALAMGGTITGEHGVGSLKAKWLPARAGRGRDGPAASGQGGLRPARDHEPGQGPLSVPRPAGRNGP